MKKIILKSGFTSHQKIMLATYLILPLVFLFLNLRSLIFNILKVKEYNYEITTSYLSIFISTLISTFFFLLLFSKNGILILNKEKVYSAKYIFGRYWFRKKMDLDSITDICIGSSRGKQRYVWLSAAKPDATYNVNINDIYLLNNKHTIKRHLIRTMDKDLAEKAVFQINEVLNLNYSKYNPRFDYR